MEITFSNLTLIENKNSSREIKYLDNINLDIHGGEIVGFLGDYLDVIGKLLLIIKRPSKVIPLNQKALEQKFLEVFDLINDDCIYVEPKFIPIIPGDDPAVLNKASDDYF